MTTVNYKLIGTLETQLNDFTGEPVIGGYLYSYKATDHATKKNISKISTPTLPADFYENPIELDSSGSIPVPYVTYFADDELYYLVLTTADQDPFVPPIIENIIRTWDNFGPDVEPTPPIEDTDFTNYILNSQFRFWRKQSYASADLVANEDVYIADTGWIFKRNNVISTISIDFTSFTPGQTVVPNNPLYACHFSSNIGSGETEKDMLSKIADVTSFSGETIQIAFWAISPTSSECEIVVRQYFGDGGSAENIILNSVQLVNSYAQYTLSIDIPSVTGKTIGTGNAIYIGLRPPLNAASELSHVNWQLNRGSTLLEYDYKTPEIEQESQRTYQLPYANDEDTSLYIKWNGAAYEFDTADVGTIKLDFGESKTGYLIADGSSYYAYDTISETNDKVTYKRLYDHWESKIKTNVGSPYFDYNGNAFGYGTKGFMPIALYDSNATYFNPVAYGVVTNWADNDTGFTFARLTGGETNVRSRSAFYIRKVSQIIPSGLYSGPGDILLENKTNGTVSAVTTGTLGATYMTVTQETVGSPSAKEKTYIKFTVTSGTIAAMAGKYWTYDTPEGAYYVWYKVDGTGTDPAPGGTGILIELASAYMESTIVAYVTNNTLNGYPQTKITFLAASTLSGGEYFHVYNDTEQFTFYMVVDGTGSAPTVPAAKKILPIAVDGTDTANQVRDKSSVVIKSLYFQVPDMRGLGIRGADNGRGLAIDEAKRFIRGDLGHGVDVGSPERDRFRGHKHLEAQNTGTDPAHGNGAANQGSATGLPKQITAETGGLETRMMNISINYFIKY